MRIELLVWVVHANKLIRDSFLGGQKATELLMRGAQENKPPPLKGKLRSSRK